MQFSKMIVALVVILNILFAAAVLAVYWHTGSEPAALVGAWFAFTTGELWLCASIKKKKIGGVCSPMSDESNTAEEEQNDD